VPAAPVCGVAAHGSLIPADTRPGTAASTSNAQQRAATSMAQPSDQPVIHKPTTEARPGTTGHNVRYVLGFSLAGVLVGFALIHIWFAAS
jgi:hypothetical protein